MIEKTKVITGIGSGDNQECPFYLKPKGLIHHFNNLMAKAIYEIANSEHFYIQI